MALGLEGLNSRIAGLFAKNSVGRATTQLISGNIIAQIVIVAALPVITRMYSLEEMSLLALYVAILTMVAVVACLRLEIAIPIPQSDTVAANLAALAVISSLVIAVVISILLLIVWMVDFQYLTGHALWRYAWLFPVGSLFVGLYATAQFWSTRMARYSLLGRTKVYQALVGSATQIIAGLMSIVPLGLLLGHLLMSGAGFFSLFRTAWKNERHLIPEVSWARMKIAFVEYKNFPKFSIIEGLANSGAQQLTIILIATFVAGPEAGFFFLAMRFLQAPIGMVTNAVSQIYLQHAPKHMRSGTLRQFTKRILYTVGAIFVVPVSLLGFNAKAIFTFAFGEAWARSGEIAAILTPMLMLSLLSASIGMIMNVTGQQKAMMYLKLLGIALRVGCVTAAILYSPSMVIEFFAVSSFIYYALCTAIFYRASKQCIDSVPTIGGIK